MQHNVRPTDRRHRPLVLGPVLMLALATVTACASDDPAPGTLGEGDTVQVSLITKDAVNPFFQALREGAEAEAEAQDVDLTYAAGQRDGDVDTQINAIDDAITRGDDGILITPTSEDVYDKIAEAREAGLFVIALDTPTDPPDVVDITFATDNFKAGQLIGEWTAETLAGEKATIALLDVFTDQVVAVDYLRDQGFLDGMGIDTKDEKVNGDEDPTGTYSGGDYEIVCNEATNGATDGGLTAMETCLTKNEDINVVYTINEPAAAGARQALDAAGKDDVIVVSVDGGCDGVEDVESGVIQATAQQYPVDMARLGVEAIATIARGGEAPETSPGLDIFDTGVGLVTDEPADGVESIDTAEGLELCWG